MNASTIKFTHCLLWVQVWGLPFELFSEDVAMDIGKGIGKVVEVDCKGVAADQAKFLRIRVEVPLDKPLRWGSKIKGLDGEVVWVVFKYERLISFCFCCGILGHEVKTCEKPRGKEEQENQYGEWMKAGFQQMEEPSRNNNQSQSQRREAVSAERAQAEMDRSNNNSSENHGTMNEVNALNVSGVNIASVMDRNSFPSIQNDSPMHLDVIMEKGNNKRVAKERQTELEEVQLFSVPIGIDVATINTPNPKPNAPPTMPKSHEHLSDTNTATKQTTTERKERSKVAVIQKVTTKEKHRFPRVQQ